MNKIKNDSVKRIIYLLIGIAIFILYYKIIPDLFKYVYNHYLNFSNKILKSTFLISMEITIFLILFLIFRKTILEDLKKFKNDYRKKLDIGFKYYFIGIFIMIISNLILAAITGDIAKNEELNREYLKMYPVYSIIAMVVLGPTIEELVFRLGFRKAFKSWLPYALFSGLLFGGLHAYTAFEGMSFQEALKHWVYALYTIPYGALGFAFAKVYYDTKNICTTALIHTIHNAFSIFLIFFAMR